jgi:hypothetical protein
MYFFSLEMSSGIIPIKSSVFSFPPEIRISGGKHLDFGSVDLDPRSPSGDRLKLPPETLFQRVSGHRGLPAAVCSHPELLFPDENYLEKDVIGVEFFPSFQ